MASMNQTPEHASQSLDSPWTTRKLLDWLRKDLAGHGIEDANVCAELLLAHVLDCDRMRLYMEVDRACTDSQRKTLKDLVMRARANEPIQYIVGQAWFHGRRFSVGSSTLIPRPATETLVELAIDHLRSASPGARMLDVGTGTGCIIISILLGLRTSGGGHASEAAGEIEAIATDLIPEAIQLATGNAEDHGLADAIEFRQGSLLEPLWPDDRKFDLIVSNPPYISDEEWDQLPENVRCHEPESALRGGHGGIELIGPLLESASSWLNPGGLLLVEIGADQGNRVVEAAGNVPGFAGARIGIHRDHEDHDRVLAVRLPA